ncbi:unnamed protein product [Eruca vesicaria subsp. sativa]|uniref:Uncharacterized protein n=1 Tax=Eruca vesicaria subsp. sativa TaxID=29727 RepID=A0ABC8LJE2_ERUVS|nr:unnamed protein product [Eruca vesicaria subsp. sativa]
MSNVRPWFRLSSIARTTSQGSSDPPPPPQQTPSRPVVVKPPTKKTSPPSPPRQQTPPPPPPQELSPYHSPSSRHTSPPTPIKAKSPLSTPTRSSYTPQPSPKEVQEALPPPRKPTSPPSPAHSTRFRKAQPPKVLSPYTLPPSQLHSERETTQKNILTAVQTSQLHEPNHQGNNTKKTHHQSYFSESGNLMRTRFITIAGENKGAVMEIVQSPSTREGTHSSVNGQRVQSSSSSDEGEGKKKTNNKMDLPMKAFINSNVQMINNSIVYNSTATHHDPGIHLKVYRKPASGNGFHVKDYGNNGDGYTN